MVNKLTLQNIINKYHLGENESVKWEIEDKILTIDFMSPNKELIGKITASGIDIEDSTLAIFDTKKLLNLLNITTGDLLLDIEKIHKTPVKLNISDAYFNLTYALADLLLISKVGSVKPPDWDIEISLENENISNLIKAKNALSEVDNLVVSIDIDPNEDKMCRFSFGDEQGHNNKINYNLYGKINIDKMNIPFNSNIFKNILSANKEPTSGILRISSRGLIIWNLKLGVLKVNII